MQIDPRSNVHLDWFDFTIAPDRLDDLLLQLAAFGILGEEEPGRFNVRYNRARRFAGGVGGVFWIADEEGRCTSPEVFCSLRGSVLAMASADDQFEFFWWLESTWELGADRDYKVTRFDVAFDDWDWVITPEQIWTDYVRPGNFGPYKRKLQLSGGKESGEGGEGYTVQLGLRGKLGGGVMLVIYDKRAESAGVVDAVRYEARFYDPRAPLAWASVMEGIGSVEGWTVKLGELVGGAAEFYTAATVGEKNAGRREAAPWWEQIRGWLRLRQGEGGPRAPRRSRRRAAGS